MKFNLGLDKENYRNKFRRQTEHRVLIRADDDRQNRTMKIRHCPILMGAMRTTGTMNLLRGEVFHPIECYQPLSVEHLVLA